MWKKKETDRESIRLLISSTGRPSVSLHWFELDGHQQLPPSLSRARKREREDEEASSSPQKEDKDRLGLELGTGNRSKERDSR